MNRSDDDPDADLAALLRASRGLEEPPQHAIERAYGAWRPRHVAAPARRTLAAVLGFDSLLMPALGVRGEGGTTRQLLYSAEGRDVDLRLSARADGSHGVSGQLLGPDRGGRVRLQVEAHVQETAIDELGEFAFAPCPAGDARLALELGDTVIELPAFDLGAPGRL